MAIEVLAQREWTFGWAGISGAIEKPYSGKLTKCVLDGIVFYVRENLHHNQFLSNSGVGVAIKSGKKVGIEILQLCAPPAIWVEISRAVQDADSKHRPVLKHRLFTFKWAEKEFPKENP